MAQLPQRGIKRAWVLNPLDHDTVSVGGRRQPADPDINTHP